MGPAGGCPATQRVARGLGGVLVNVDYRVQSEGPVVAALAAKLGQGLGAVDRSFVEVSEDVAISLRGRPPVGGC